MTITLPIGYAAEKNKLTQTDPWIWLIELWASNTITIGITPYLQNVTWPASGGNVYYAYPVLPPAWQASSEGELPSAKMTIPNPDGQLTPLLDAYGGLRDKRVVSRLAHSTLLAATSLPTVIWDIEKVTARREAVDFHLGPRHVHSHEIPRHLWSRTLCRWKFGGRECGYNTARPGARFSSCPKTMQACIERGDDEVAGGLERLHPRRIGIFPAIAVVRQ